MNKTLIAALSGIAFGAVLGGLAASNSGSPHQLQVTLADCPAVAAPVCPAVLPPPPPLPAHCDSDDADEPDAPAPLRMDADSQLSRAQTEYVNGNYQRAIDIARSVASESPERANRIMGAAACNLHDAELATQVYKKLQVPARSYLVYVCQRNGMIQVGNHFKHRP